MGRNVRKALSVDNILNAKFNIIKMEDKWLEAFGEIEQTGTILIYGDSKQGKTDFALQLSKELSKKSRILYHSSEEGLSKSMQSSIERNKMREVGRRFMMTDRETIEELIGRLEKRRSPEIIVIDSIQFSGLDFKTYKEMREKFKRKLFIYISHVKGRQLDGSVAMKIYRDSNITCRVEGFRMFPISRYGGGKHIDISERLAREYWGLQN